MKNKNGLQNESRQQNDINVRAGPRGIERVKVEAPVRPLEKWAGSRGKEAGEKEKRRERGLTRVIYVSRHEGFQPLIT